MRQKATRLIVGLPPDAPRPSEGQGVFSVKAHGISWPRRRSPAKCRGHGRASGPPKSGNRTISRIFRASSRRHAGCSWARVLRISRIDQKDAGICLRVEGRLSGDWVALLEGELAEASRTTASLSLDLAAVNFASLQATEMLRVATARGVRVVACSPFLAKLLVTSAP